METALFIPRGKIWGRFFSKGTFSDEGGEKLAKKKEKDVVHLIDDKKKKGEKLS